MTWAAQALCHHRFAASSRPAGRAAEAGGRRPRKETDDDRGLADPKFVVDDLIAEGDRVAARVTSSARQVDPFMSMPGTGKSYSISEIHIFRIADGKIAEHWHQLDAMGMMQQLGMMPAKP